MQLSDIFRNRRSAAGFCVKAALCSAVFALAGEPLLRIWRNLESLAGQSPSSLLSFAVQIHPLAVCVLFLCGIPVFGSLFLFGSQIGEFVYHWRFLLAAAVLALCVIFDISGSSIHMWSEYLDSSSDGRLLGAARALRSDEWALNTPFAVSQCSDIAGNAFSYFSDIVRGTSTNMFIVYGQPVLDFAELFRPFHWGYLLFGAGRGLSFFWCARQIALLLVSFELEMLLTGQKRLLSLLFSVTLSFSSFVQWWFAINGLVEMIIFGFLAVLVIYKYMHTERFRTRLICALVLTECACAFVLTFYPAWMVPIGYILAGLALWVIVTSWKTFRFRRKYDLPLLALFLLLTAGSLSYILFYRSWDTIQLTMNTVYPGNRVELTPLDISFFGSVIGNFFTPFWDMSLPVNSVENAAMLSFMPLGTVLAVFLMIRRKKPDSLSIILLVLSAVFFVYVFVGFNELAANVTLLRFSTPGRALPMLHLAQFLLLYRSLALLQKPLRVKSVLILGTVSWLCILFPAFSYCSGYLENLSFSLGAGAMLLLMLLLPAACGRRHIRQIFSVFAALTVFFTGILVNPVQQGIGELTGSAAHEMVSAVTARDSEGLWIVEGGGYPLINLPITAGAPTINSSNVYPALERWRLFDADGSEEEIYNRYAHITITLAQEETHFEPLTAADVFTLHLNPSDLQTLNVKYILTLRDLSEFTTPDTEFTKLDEQGDFLIYQINYR